MNQHNDSENQVVGLTWQKAKMLFELHHRQLNETQMQLQSITEKSFALALLMTGWIVLSDTAPERELKILLAFGVGVFGLTVIIFLIRNAIGRRRVAAVIQRLNEYFCLFEKGSGQHPDPIYPAEWSGFGKRHLRQFVGAHVVAVIIVTIIAELAIFVK